MTEAFNRPVLITKTNQNLPGILLMIASMAAFAVTDALVKHTSNTMAPSQILLLLMVGGLLVFVLLAVIQREKLLHRSAFSRIMWLRYVAEVVGMIGMVNALATVDLSIVGAVSQGTPIFVTLCAVIFLGETISWRRLTSIICGFLGVLIIVRPGGEQFDVAVLWTLVALVGMGVRDLTSAVIPRQIASSVIAAYTMIAAIPFAVAWTLASGLPIVSDNLDYTVVVPMVVLGSVGYLLIITSMRIAPISVVIPFRYSRVLFLLLLGVVFFGERPDVWTLVGATIVVCSGLYIWWREQHSNKA